MPFKWVKEERISKDSKGWKEYDQNIFKLKIVLNKNIRDKKCLPIISFIFNGYLHVLKQKYYALQTLLSNS